LRLAAELAESEPKKCWQCSKRRRRRGISEQRRVQLLVLGSVAAKAKAKAAVVPAIMRISSKQTTFKMLKDE
jgi:hypothetical protein